MRPGAALEDGQHSGKKKLGREPLVSRGRPCNAEKPRVSRDQGWTWGAGDGDDEKEGSRRQGRDAFETGLRRHTWFLKTLSGREKPQSWQAPGCQG